MEAVVEDDLIEVGEGVILQEIEIDGEEDNACS